MLAFILSVMLPALYAIVRARDLLLVQVANTAFILFTGSCTILALMMTIRTGAHGRLGRMHVGLLTGMLLICLGALTDGVYAIEFGAPPASPSLADAFNFLGYAFAVLAIFQFLWYFRTMLSKLQLRLVPFLGALVAGPNLVLAQPNLASTTLIATVTWLAYPILDGMLLMLGVMVVILFSKGILSSCWRWLAVGMLLITIADILIGIGHVRGWIEFVEPFYIFYLWGYICFGVGFSLMPKLERLHPLERDYHKTRLMRPAE